VPAVAHQLKEEGALREREEGVGTACRGAGHGAAGITIVESTLPLGSFWG
jgi:hypothetical protein